MTPAAAHRDEAAARQVITALTAWRADQSGVLVVAIDGHGTAGKSTLAGRIAAATGAALVHTDDFFQLPAAPAGQPRRRQPLSQYYDWRRIRAQALEPLRARRGVAFRRFDWSRGAGLDGVVTVAPADLILLEGVFSAAPELSDLVDRSVFVDTPEHERLRRLHARVAPADWDPDWLLAEQSYFGLTRPNVSFDLIVSGTSPVPAGPAGGTS